MGKEVGKDPALPLSRLAPVGSSFYSRLKHSEIEAVAVTAVASTRALSSWDENVLMQIALYRGNHLI